MPEIPTLPPISISGHPNVNRFICFGGPDDKVQESRGGHSFITTATSLREALQIVGDPGTKHYWANVLDLVTGELYTNIGIIQKKVPSA
jgi:hypothetical protein